MIEKFVNQEEDDAMLRETGRLTSRLIHDFKNQLGGMKLYATYLKKRFAENAEGAEVAEKIIQGLNEMAEQAAWVSKRNAQPMGREPLTGPGQPQEPWRTVVA